MNNCFEINPVTKKMPRIVKMALIIQFGSFIRSTPKLIYVIKNDPNGINSIHTWGPVFIMAGILTTLFVGIICRRHWGRIGTLIIYLLALCVQIRNMIKDYNIYNISHYSTIDLIVFVITLFSVGLLFSKNANMWFRLKQ